ncbi:methyltransferase [Streptomyces sp. NPDC006739]|uniref:methyltransferase n=1 Tax=Streptomyces sp. NPDC006739 TaxID=3364763 RepID=UPI0036A96A42
MNTTAATADRVMERFLLIANGPALFNAIVTGLEMDIFARLSVPGGATFEELVAHTKIPCHNLRILMLALCSTELVVKQSDRYTNSSVAEDLLASDAPDSWRHIMIGWQRIYYPAFAHMTSALRSGTNHAALAQHAGTEESLYQRLAHDPTLEEIFHRAMSAFTLRTMSSLTSNKEFSQVRHLLDVGGGSGTTARAIAEVHPQMRVTIFDLPSVANRAIEAIPAPLKERVLAQGGDLFEDDFPGNGDAILFSHVLEVFDPGRIIYLLSKAYKALPAGGKVFIYGFNSQADEQGGVSAARLSLYLNILASGQGMAYPAADYEEWLRQAGFEEVETRQQLPYEHGLHIATKGRPA